jgi:hypothetical protein
VTADEFLAHLVRAERAANDLESGLHNDAPITRALEALRQRARPAFDAHDADGIEHAMRALTEIEREITERVEAERHDYGPRPPA